MRAVTRRGVLQAGAAVAALRWAGCGRSRPDYGGFSMSIQSWTFRQFGTDDTLRFVSDLGLAYVELFENHWSIASSDADIASMRARLDDLGIRCLTHGMNVFTADDAANRAVFEFARKAGVRNLLADPPLDAFASLDALVAEYDVRIAIHNHGPGSQYPTIASVVTALAGREPRVGTCIDTGHYLRAGEDPVDAIHQLAGRIYGIHLKDVAAPAADAPDVVLGDGVLDVAAVFAALHEVGLPGDAAVSLEYEANPDAPYDDVERALAVAADAAG